MVLKRLPSILNTDLQPADALRKRSPFGSVETRFRTCKHAVVTVLSYARASVLGRFCNCMRTVPMLVGPQRQFVQPQNGQEAAASQRGAVNK